MSVVTEADRAVAQKLEGCNHEGLCVHCRDIAQAIAEARGDRYERAPANIRHLLYHCLDQADKHQWFNFVHVLGELAQEAMRSLRDDLEAARRGAP